MKQEPEYDQLNCIEKMVYLISEDTENCVLDTLPSNFLQQFTLNEPYQSLATIDIERIGQTVKVHAIVNS